MSTYTSKYSSGAAVDAALDASADHIGSTANPHSTNLAQVGGSNRNLLINGDDLIAQRGDTFTGNGYTVDMWYAQDCAQVDRLTNTSPAPCKYQIKVTCGSGYNIIAQPLEDYALYQGKTLTASFWGKSAEGAVITVSTYGGEQSIQLTSTWILYTVTFTANFGTYIWERGLRFDAYNQSGKTYELARRRLESGTVSTLVNDKPAVRGDQLDRCRSYLYKFNPYDIYPCVYYSTDIIDIGVSLPAAMRIAPSIVGSGMRIVSPAGEQTGFTFSLATAYNNCSYLRIRATKASHGLTSGAYLEIGDNATFLTAEL